jgi:hypothetical protein
MTARLRPLVPDVAYRSGWTSGAFMAYAGAYVIVTSLISLLIAVATDSGDLGQTVLATIVFAALLAIAIVLRSAGRQIAAGLFATLALFAFGFAVGFAEDWAGLLPDDGGDSVFLESFEPGVVLFALLVVALGVGLVAVFRFPLLVLPTAVVAWYAVSHTLVSLWPGEPSSNVQAFLTLLVGAALAVLGLVVDRSGRPAYGFWLHVVGGTVIAGALGTLLHEETWQWVVLGAISLAFVLVAEEIARSSYAVLGTLGLIFVGGLFVDKWFSTPPELIPFFGFVPFFIFGSGFGEEAAWSGPLAFAVVGAIVVGLGVLLEEGRLPVPRRTQAAP